ncbi:hypothetical protein AX14_005633, partial [Amanita brunnescens Koide BX004]
SVAVSWALWWTSLGALVLASAGWNYLPNPSVTNASLGDTRALDAPLMSSSAHGPRPLMHPLLSELSGKERHAELYAEIEAKFPKTDRKSGPGKKKKVGFSGPDADGFVQVGFTTGIARIDAVPSNPPSPAPPDSVKPTTGSIVGALADEALRPELRGNDEARRLMQETLADEAAFAAADALAAADTGRDLAPSGSPPLSLSYAQICLSQLISLTHALRSRTSTSLG